MAQISVCSAYDPLSLDRLIYNYFDNLHFSEKTAKRSVVLASHILELADFLKLL